MAILNNGNKAQKLRQSRQTSTPKEPILSKTKKQLRLPKSKKSKKKRRLAELRISLVIYNQSKSHNLL